MLSVARPEATRSKCSRRTRCPSYKRRFTTSDAHSATSAPDFLVYRRAVGDGRASKPQSRRGGEFRLQQRRTRCPSYKEDAANDRPADSGRHPFSPCTTDILSVVRPGACDRADNRIGLVRSARDGQDIRRTTRRFTAIEAQSATPAPAFLVYRRAVGDGRASKP